MPPPGFCVVWPWPLTFWPQKSMLSCSTMNFWVRRSKVKVRRVRRRTPKLDWRPGRGITLDPLGWVCFQFKKNSSYFGFMRLVLIYCCYVSVPVFCLILFCVSTAYAAPEALYFCLALSVAVSVSCSVYICRFAKTLNVFRWNLREIIVIANRLNSYILGEIRTGTREQDTTEYSNRRQSLLLRGQTGADPWRIISQISLHKLIQLRSVTSSLR